ncbi:esterase/lipase [Apiospora hydei]|uniref:Esterase/lipase n=1 Tax=Apiospora hydei TaxID=1337664 RepID=A0ABR1WC77_9PEZI
MALQQLLGGLFRSLRLHTFVFVFRILLHWRTAAHIRRDNAVLPLAEAGVRKKRFLIPSRDPGRTILAHLYLPLKPSEDGRPLPVLRLRLPLHGTDAYFCTRMARDAGLAVLDADYRKAPEHPFPAAIDDAEDALRWVASHAASAAYNLDPSRVAVSGFSAGGHIAAVAASHLKQKLETEKEEKLGGLKIQMLLSIYGSTDLATDATTKKPPSPSLRAHAPLDPQHVRRRLRARPGFAGGPGRVAGTTAFLTCEGDNLRWEIETLVERLREMEGGTEGNEGNGGKKREVHYKMLEGVCHAFDKGIKEDGGGSLVWRRREEAYAWAASLLKDALHPQQ